MRRVLLLAVSLLLTALLIFPVLGATGASGLNTYATVSNNGSCQVSMNITLHLDQAVEDLTFPVPTEATSVTLNGSRVRTTKTDTARLINLSRITKNVIGDISFSVTYALSNIIHKTETEQLELQLPLLSGFSYPVENMEFSVTMPGEISVKPAFTSGYHQANIEQDLTFQTNGAMVTGASTSQMKDHETLILTLIVSEEMFPQTAVYVPTYGAVYIAIGVASALALLYWLLTMRCLPPRHSRESAAPDGYSAGELGSVLSLQGADLTMMVFSWAQLGYILIQPDRHGRVLLHKRMDMGNERSGFERRCFQNLFGKRDVVDTSGMSYAMLQQKISKLKPNLQTFVKPRSGNPVVFRALAAGINLCCGMCLGIALSAGAALQWLLVFLLALFGGFAGWRIQNWAYGLFLRHPDRLRAAWILCAAELLFGLLSGQFGLALLGCCTQLLAGLMAAFGGRRTEAGKQIMGQVLGLRRYLRSVPKEEIERICQRDPEFFHSLAPYALALGADNAFAARFGRMQLPGCPYLTTGMDGHMTAGEWSRLLRRTASQMDERARQISKERLMGFIHSLIK